MRADRIAVQALISNTAAIVAAIYILFAVIWIVFTDFLALSLSAGSAESLAALQQVKGLGFIAATAVLFYAVLRPQIKARSTAESAYRERDLTFRLLFEQASDAALIVRRDAILDCNPAAIKIFGLESKVALLRLKPIDLYPERQPDGSRSRERLRELIAESSPQGPGVFEWVCRRMDGETFPVEVTLTTLTLNQKKALYVALRDLTERKKIENTLAESEATLRAIFDCSHEALVLLDPDGMILAFNPMAADRADRLFGKNIQAGRSIIEFVEPGQEGAFARLLRSVVDRGARAGAHREYWTPTGSEWYEITYSPVKAPNGTLVGICMSARDVTEQKQAEEGLRSSQEQLRNILDLAPVGISIYNPQGRINYANQAVAEILGVQLPIRSDSSSGRPSWIIRTPNGEVIAEEEQPFATIMQTGRPVHGVEYILETPEREAKILRVNGAPLFDGLGKITGVVFSLDDITERRKALIALREREEQYRLLFENTPAGIFHFDRNLRATACNDRLAEILRTEPGAIAGSDLHRLVGVKATAVLKAALRGEESICDGIQIVLPGLQTAWISLRSAPMFGADKTIVGGVGIAEDITARKKAEQEIAIAYDSTLEGWSRAMEMRDQETQGHAERVTALTLQLARALGIPEEEMVNIRRGALLHDIGKMVIPDGILQKPGERSDAEWEVMRLHPVYAYELLSPIPFMSRALDIPYYHHEKWDGTGYPHGLRGAEIPLSARVFAIVDVVDALRKDRPYRPAWPEEKIRQHILDEKGKHFDPDVVDKFLEMGFSESA